MIKLSRMVPRWLRESELDVGLLPVTKAQFEMFLQTSPEGLRLSWYEDVRNLNARPAEGEFSLATREQVFLTGIQPNEALAFARWLGDDYDLPTMEEWRLMDRVLLDKPLTIPQNAPQPNETDPASNIFLAIWNRLRPRTWGELMFLRGGVFEWVRLDDRQHAALSGRTRPEFLRSVFNPQKDNPVIHYGERSGYFGFRVVRRRPPGANNGRVIR